MTVTELPFAPRFEVRISGVTLAAELADQILSLEVETDLDLAGSFRFTLRNGDNRLLDSALLDPGKTVEIHLGYGRELVPAFLGEIAAIEPSFPRDGPPTIQVTGYDKSHRMRNAQPRPTQYRFLNDSVIAAQIALANGLIPVIDPTPGLPAQSIQVESDMAFLKSRARRYFFDVYVEWDRLHFQFPRPQPAAYVLEWGRTLSSFSPRISATGLAGLQVIRSYSQELAQTIAVTALAADLTADDLVERLGSSAVDFVGALARRGLLHQPVDSPLEAAELARSLLAELLEGLYEGTGSCIGLPDLRAGTYVAVAGVGRRFSGTYRLRKVTHRIDDSGFSTDFSITQRAHSSLVGLLRKHVTETPSPTRAERFHGVVLGVVEENNELRDVPPQLPLGRVKVSFPRLADDVVSTWAPCVRPMAGADSGFYALPEPGDQVLVAFEDGDLGKPYVLGGLWNAQQRPPATNADGLNSTRVIKSRSGHTITFDDTPVAGKLVIQDAKGSRITMNSLDGSVTVSAAGDLTLSANRTLTLRAAAGATSIVMDATQVNVT